MKSKFTRTLMAMSFVAAASISASALDAGNPYAYDIRVNSSDQHKPVVTYKLNAPAAGVKVQAFIDGTLVQTVDGEASKHGTDYSVTFDLKDYAGKVTFKVVTSMSATQAVGTPSVIGRYDGGGKITSVTVNRDPNSPTFGQIITSERTGSNIGLHVYSPNFTDTGRKGITGGISTTDTDNSYMGLIHRVRFSEDGRLFGLCGLYGTNALYEFDPTSLEATAVLQGTTSATDGTVKSGSTYVGGSGGGLDVWGSGADLKIATISSTDRHYAWAKKQRVNIYNLGTKTSWSGAPSATTNEGALLANFQRAANINVAFDKDGKGIGVTGYASTPSNTDRNYIHADAATLTSNLVLTSDATLMSNLAWTYASAMAYNADRSILAVVAGRKIRFYNVTVSNGGKPTFTHKGDCDLTKYSEINSLSDGAAHIDDIAFDYAGNIFFCVNGNSKVYGIVGPYTDKSFSVPAPASTAYTKTAYAIPPSDNFSVTLTEAQTCAGRTMVSLRWSGKYSDGSSAVLNYYEIYRDGELIVANFAASSYIDTDLTDGTHKYVIRGYGYSADGVTMGYAESNEMSVTIERDPAMTVYYLEEVYNYPILSPDEKTELASSSSDVVLAQGVIANMHVHHSSANGQNTSDGGWSGGARGDLYRQGVFKVVNGKPTWYIAQLTDRAAEGKNKDGNPYVWTYNAIKTNEKAGVIQFDAEDPRKTPSRIYEYYSMVNQSLAIFDAPASAPFDGTSVIPADGTVTMLMRANDNLNNVTTQNSNAGGGRFLDAMHQLGRVEVPVSTGKAGKMAACALSDVDFYSKYKDANFYKKDFPDKQKVDEEGNLVMAAQAKPSQYYRTHYFNTSGTAQNGRFFSAMNYSRDVYVFDYKNNAITGYKCYTAPDAGKQGTENYAIPIEGRKDFLHMIRSTAVYYVNVETGEYTELQVSDAEKKSACGATFVFNNELFFIHPTSDHSNNPGHFRIDMPTRQWDSEQRKFVTDFTKADFQKMVPQAAFVQDDYMDNVMGYAGNSNATFYGFMDATETVDGVTYPVKYIYQYVPGVRFAKYKFYPKNEFPSVQPDLDIVLENKDSDDDKSSLYNHGTEAAEEMGHYSVQYGWYPRPFEQEEGTDFVTDHYVYEVKDSKGNVVASGTIAYVEGQTYYQMPEYAPDLGEDGKGVACNEEYTITVTPYYRNTSNSDDIRPGGAGVAKDVISYTPDVKPISARPYEHKNEDGDHENMYRVDIDFDRAPRNTAEAEPGDNIVPEEVSYFIVQYQEPGGEWTNIPDFKLHIGDQEYDCPDGIIPGDYDFKNDKGQIPGADPNEEPDCVGYYFVNGEKPAEGTKYRVIAVYGDDNPVITNQAEKETGLGEWGQTGVEDITIDGADSAINVYPIPAVDYINVQSARAISNVNVVSVNGTIVKSESFPADANNVKIYVGDLAAGVYFVAVNNGAPVRIVKK